MNTNEFAQLARRVVRQPTAPYEEHFVRREVENILRENGIPQKRDRHGNVIAHLRTVSGLRPLVFAAHMDHPGFRLQAKLSPRKWVAKFCGSVPEDYFQKGIRLRLFPGGTRAVLSACQTRDKTFELEALEPPADEPVFAMWELEDFRLRNGRLVSRACDDLVGTACALAALLDLKRAKAKVNVMAVFSRAEEVGFQGALALGADKSLPKSALVVSLETSREVPGVRQGRGVILRVGDKATTFDPGANLFLAQVAEGLSKRETGFHYQRALMPGGTCEATAYQYAGYQTTGACVALRNYHNCGAAARIRPENIHLGDAVTMVDLLVAAAGQMPRYSELCAQLDDRLEGLLAEARRTLSSS